MSPHAPALFTARRAVYQGGWVGRNSGRYDRERGLGTQCQAPTLCRTTFRYKFFIDCAQIQPLVLLWQFLSVILTAVLLYGGNYKRPINIGRLWVFLHGVKITKGRCSVRTSSRSLRVRKWLLPELRVPSVLYRKHNTYTFSNSSSYIIRINIFVPLQVRHFVVVFVWLVPLVYVV